MAVDRGAIVRAHIKCSVTPHNMTPMTQSTVVRRRSLVVGGLAAGLGIGRPRAADPTPAVPSGFALPPRSPHVGTNLAGMAYWSTQFPFADLMKSGMGWWSLECGRRRGRQVPAMTADGYPAALKPGQRAVNAVAWGDTHYPAGRYVVLWDGAGSIGFPMSTVTVARRRPAASRSTSPTRRVRSGSHRQHEPDQSGAQRALLLARHRGERYATQPFNPEFLKQARSRSRRSASWTGA